MSAFFNPGNSASRWYSVAVCYQLIVITVQGVSNWISTYIIKHMSDSKNYTILCCSERTIQYLKEIHIDFWRCGHWRFYGKLSKLTQSTFTIFVYSLQTKWGGDRRTISMKTYTLAARESNWGPDISAVASGLRTRDWIDWARVPPSPKKGTDRMEAFGCLKRPPIFSTVKLERNIFCIVNPTISDSIVINSFQ